MFKTRRRTSESAASSSSSSASSETRAKRTRFRERELDEEEDASESEHIERVHFFPEYLDETDDDATFPPNLLFVASRRPERSILRAPRELPLTSEALPEENIDTLLGRLNINMIVFTQQSRKNVDLFILVKALKAINTAYKRLIADLTGDLAIDALFSRYGRLSATVMETYMNFKAAIDTFRPHIDSLPILVDEYLKELRIIITILGKSAPAAQRVRSPNPGS